MNDSVREEYKYYFPSSHDTIINYLLIEQTGAKFKNKVINTNVCYNIVPQKYYSNFTYVLKIYLFNLNLNECKEHLIDIYFINSFQINTPLYPMVHLRMFNLPLETCNCLLCLVL